MKSYQTVFLALVLLASSFAAAGQDLNAKINQLEKEKKELDKRKTTILSELEQLKLSKIRSDLRAVGLPKGIDNLQEVEHAAMILGYNEKHEQPDWVAHIVLPDVQEGNLSRTNDFREDSLVSTGTAVKADYWYSGFDRGHLAPSADFRWSAQAISESYFYSNMSPQRPEFNRERWAELENWTRSAVMAQNEQLIVITGPVLRDGLPQITQGPNKVTIPEYYYKIILDIEGKDKKAIAFVMPNKDCGYPVISYAVSVDSVERLTGLDFFSALEDGLENQLESKFDVTKWERDIEGEMPDVPPMANKEMPKNCINTVDAKYFLNQKVTVCGTVVSTKKTKSGSVFINLDTKFPNQIFSISIWGNDIKNFPYQPEMELMGKKVCVTGMPKDYKGTPSVNITDDKKIQFLEEED